MSGKAAAVEFLGQDHGRPAQVHAVVAHRLPEGELAVAYHGSARVYKFILLAAHVEYLQGANSGAVSREPNTKVVGLTHCVVGSMALSTSMLPILQPFDYRITVFREGLALGSLIQTPPCRHKSRLGLKSSKLIAAELFGRRQKWVSLTCRLTHITR